MAKKTNLITIAAIGVAAYFIITSMRKRGGVTVTAESPIKQTASEYEADYAATQTREKAKPIETIKNIVSTFFPKKTAAEKKAAQLVKSQKQAVKALKSKSTAKQKKGAAKLTKNIVMPTFSGFSDDMVIY